MLVWVRLLRLTSRRRNLHAGSICADDEDLQRSPLCSAAANLARIEFSSSDWLCWSVQSTLWSTLGWVTSTFGAFGALGRRLKIEHHGRHRVGCNCCWPESDIFKHFWTSKCTQYTLNLSMNYAKLFWKNFFAWESKFRDKNCKIFETLWAILN